MLLPDKIAQWLASVAGGAIIAVHAIAGGGQRKTFFVEVEGGRELVLQIVLDGGSYFRTGITSLAREAKLFAALAGTAAAEVTPELVAVSPDEDAILAVRASGESDFDTVGDGERQKRLGFGLMDALAQLHSVDHHVADAVGFAKIADGKDAALSWLHIWRDLFVHVRRPAPLLRIALCWLEENAPERHGPVVICHGDTGPGNFLFAGDEFTKLVDWELAHLGDYHCDLGMLALRGFQLGAMQDIDGVLQRYAQASGRRVDGWMVRYYRAAALVLALTTTLKQVDTAAASEKPMVAMPLFLHLLPMLQLLLAEALLDLAGRKPEPSQLPKPELVPEEQDVALAYLGIESTLSDHKLAGGQVSFHHLSQHLAARAKFGHSVERLELDDLERLLGDRPESVASGKERLDRALDTGGLDDDALLGWAWRSAKRQSLLWPAWSGYFERGLLPIADEYLP